MPPPLPRALAERQAADAVKPEPGQPTTETKRTWWRRLRDGLSRSSSSLGQTFTDIFSKRKLDQETLDDLEDALLRADLGVATAGRDPRGGGQKSLRERIGAGRSETNSGDGSGASTRGGHPPLKIDAARKPFVILIVGVNGSGKTTTIGNSRRSSSRRTVRSSSPRETRPSCGDRAASDLGTTWAEVVARAQGSDPASLAFDALKRRKFGRAARIFC